MLLIAWTTSAKARDAPESTAETATIAARLAASAARAALNFHGM
jgi:hypothetical protein